MKLVAKENASSQTLSDGRTVWVNAPDGSCVSRFGRLGIDVHNTMSEQDRLGEQCLACTHGRTYLADWRSFQALTLQHHGVVVDDEHMPDFIRKELDEAGHENSPSRAALS